MVSEDSDLLVSGFLAIHGLHDLEDLDQSGASQVVAVDHHPHASNERLEIGSLRGAELMRLKEGNDHFQKFISRSDRVAIQVLSVIVVPRIDQHASDSEELSQVSETRDALRALGH